jgi:hypothetical protein
LPGHGYLAERILVLGLEFDQLRRSAGTQRRRGFRSGDLQFAATFLHGENASGAAAMVIDDGIPQNSIDPGFGTSFRPQLRLPLQNLDDELLKDLFGESRSRNLLSRNLMYLVRPLTRSSKTARFGRTVS